MAKKTLTEKEKLFCKYISLGFTPREAAAKSGYLLSERAAMKLLERKDIKSAIKRLSSPPPSKGEVVAGLRRLAFGSIADVIRLIRSESEADMNIDELDLSMVTELKFPKSGGVEVKFCDRLKALQLLGEISEDESDSDGGFFEALDRSAASVAEVRRD